MHANCPQRTRTGIDFVQFGFPGYSVLGFGGYWPSRALEHLCIEGMGVGPIGGERIGTERGLVMRKTCIVVGIVSVALCLAWGMGSPAPATAAEILIGMSAPITGGWAAEADLYVKAIKLAEKQINEAGGVNGKKIRMIITDNQSTNPGALAALNRNVEQDKVLAMIGPVKSTQILAMSDAVKAYGIPMMVGGTNASITKVGNPWFFRCRVSDAIMAAAAV